MGRVLRVFGVVSAAMVVAAPLVVGVPAAGADPTEQAFTTTGTHEFTVPAGVCAVTAVTAAVTVTAVTAAALPGQVAGSSPGVGST